MKKILLTAIVALFAVTAASAQDKGNWALGPRMNIYTNTGDAWWVWVHSDVTASRTTGVSNRR